MGFFSGTDFDRQALQQFAQQGEQAFTRGLGQRDINTILGQAQAAGMDPTETIQQILQSGATREQKADALNVLRDKRDELIRQQQGSAEAAFLGDESLSAASPKFREQIATSREKSRQEQAKTQDQQRSQAVAQQLIQALNKGEIGIEEFEQAAINIPEKEIRTQTLSVADRRRRDPERDPKFESEANKQITKDLFDARKAARENLQNARQNQQLSKRIEQNINKVTGLDTIANFMEDIGLPETLVKSFKSVPAQDIDAGSKEIQLQESKLLGGSNPSAFQTKLLAQALVSSKNNPQANHVINAYFEARNKVLESEFEIRDDVINDSTIPLPQKEREIQRHIRENADAIWQEYENKARGILDEQAPVKTKGGQREITIPKNASPEQKEAAKILKQRGVKVRTK